MGSLECLLLFCVVLFVSGWSIRAIRDYIDERRYWKWVNSHFEAKAKEHNKRILEAFEKTLESEPFKEYLMKVFREVKEKKENEIN